MKANLKKTARKRTLKLYQPDGSPFWHCRTMVNKKRVSFSTRSEMRQGAKETAESVIILAEKIGLDQAINQILPAHGKNTKATTPIDTFLEWYKECLDQSPKMQKAQTRGENEKAFRTFCKVMKIDNIEDVTPERLQAYFNQRKKDVAQNTVNSLFGKIRSVYKKEALFFYRSKGLIVKNPFDVMTNPAPYMYQQYKPFTPEIRKAILKWIIENENPRFSMIGLMALTMGLRRNEINLAKVDWITGGNIHLSGEITKSGRSRIVPIPAGIDFIAYRNRIPEYDIQVKTGKFKQIKPAKLDSEYLIPSAKNPKPENIGKVSRTYRLQRHFDLFIEKMKEAFPAVDFGNKPIHCLRRELGSVYATKEGIFVTQRILGHSTPVITASTYANLTELPKIGLADF